MSHSLSVDLNRERLHDITVTRTYTTDESFLVELTNHGEAVHIHLHLDDDLSDVARLTAGNHYVEADRTESVRVDVDPVEAPVSGKLKIVTGYGAETVYVDVTVEPLALEKRPVDVDETLSKPKHRDTSTPSLGEQFGQSVQQTNLLPVVGVGLVTVLLAIGVGVVVDSPIVFLGVGVVIGGVVAALVLQMR